MRKQYQQMAEWLQKAERILFITGAGLSADSGLPTYRGIGGLYEGGLTEEGMPIEAALSKAMLAENPAITWKYLWEIGSAIGKASFNRGHEVIAAIEQLKSGTWVLTQNVDGYHYEAGSRNLIEIHGRASTLFCPTCGLRLNAAVHFSDFQIPPTLPPECPQCAGLLRPNVVLFGEVLPEEACTRLSKVLAQGVELVVSIGTSALFPYIVQPVMKARNEGIPTVEINPSDSEISGYVNCHIKERAAPALDELWHMMQG